MPGAMVRWRQLRRRGAFLHPEQDLPQWESQILDSLSSLATVSAERWVLAGPVSGSSGQAIMAAMGGMQPGWLLRVAPASLTCDVQLPDLGAEGIGRMIAVQHSGGSRSALRLGFAGSYVGACVSPGQIAQCVWDGRQWWALTGRVEWVDATPSLLNPATGGTPLVSQAIGNWGQNLFCFPKGADTSAWVEFSLPLGWIGTGVVSNVDVLPLVSQNGTILFNHLTQFVGHEAAPAFVNFPGSAPQVQTQTGLAVAVTTTTYGYARRIPAATLSTPIELLSNTRCHLLLLIQRTGTAGGDSYTTQYAGGNNNVALLRVNCSVQACAHGVSV